MKRLSIKDALAFLYASAQLVYLSDRIFKGKGKMKPNKEYRPIFGLMFGWIFAICFLVVVVALVSKLIMVLFGG